MLIAVAISWIRGVSKVAASPTGSGNSVVPSTATPCKASLHQSYAGTFRRGIARDWFTSWEAFSWRVMRCTKSAARSSGDSLESRYGKLEVSCAKLVRLSSAKVRNEKRIVLGFFILPARHERVSEQSLSNHGATSATHDRFPVIHRRRVEY